MNPYIVRPVEPGLADLFGRPDNDIRAGRLVQRYRGWIGYCDECRYAQLHLHRAAAAEALWRHYLDEHKES